MTLTEQIITTLQTAAGLNGYTVSVNVPQSRPDRLITLTRTGGGGNRFFETATYTVDVCSPTQLEADNVGIIVRATLLDLDRLTSVSRVQVAGEAQMPKPVGGRIIPAYRINVEITHGL